MSGLFRALLCAASATFFLAGCPGGAPEAIEPNAPPVARALWPQLWPVDEPAPIDLSASADPDGLIVTILANFGDRSPEQESVDGVFQHTFPAPGTYQLRFVIEDDAGAQTELLGDIVIARTLDTPACDCERPCFEPGVCANERCYLAASSDPEEALIAPEDVLDCGAEAPPVSP